jgi:hypothetical protein
MKHLKTHRLIFILAIFLFLTSNVKGQQIVGKIFDQMRMQSFTLFDNGLLVQDGNPMNRGFVQRDPSGFMYLMVPAINPLINAYFIGWDKRFIEIDKFQGTRVIGYYQGFLPSNPWETVYKQPHYNPNVGIETPKGQFIPLPNEVIDVTKPYGNIMITNEVKAQQCYQSAYNSTTGLDKEKFSLCMVQNMAGQKELEIFNCIRNSKTPEERAICLFGKLGGQKEKEIAQKISECYSQYGNDWSRYPLCMSTSVSDPTISKVLACMEQQSKTGQVSFMGTALCYGAQSFDLNPETQIMIECAVASGGEPYTFAGCAGGQLLSRELDKCFTNGIGGSNGCFGKNNDIVKGLKAIGEAINIEFGPNNDITKLWNNTVNDITNGPGDNHEAVNIIRNVSNEVGRATNNVGKAIEKAVPKIKIKW